MSLVKKIPDYLSYFRLASVPFFLLLAYLEMRWATLILFILSGLTDFLDGKIARKLGVASEWGAQLDSVSDQLWILATVPVLYWLTPELLYYIRWPTGFVIVYFLLFRTSMLVFKNKLVTLHLWSGKTAVFFFYFMIISFLYFNTLNPLVLLFIWLFFITCIWDIIEETLVSLVFENVPSDTNSLFHLWKERKR